MALTREVGSRQLVTQPITLTADQQTWTAVLGADAERRGALLYIDPAAPGPAYLADTEQHARSRSNGAPFFPAGSPRGFELGVTGAVYVYALDADLAKGPIVVYLVYELGQVPDVAN